MKYRKHTIFQGKFQEKRISAVQKAREMPQDTILFLFQIEIVMQNLDLFYVLNSFGYFENFCHFLQVFFFLIIFPKNQYLFLF